MAKEASTKTTSTNATGKGFAAAKPAAKAPAKRKDALGVLADKTIAAKKPAKVRSGAAKRAEPIPAKKVASKAAKAATPALKAPLKKSDVIEQIKVKNVGQLIAVLGNFKPTSPISTLGGSLSVENIRGRTIATIRRADKPVKAAAKK